MSSCLHILAVLQGDPGAPADLRDRALVLAGRVLELSGSVPAGAGHAAARAILADGRAWRKFQAICDAQGGLREPPRAPLTQTIDATRGGRITRIDNRRLARIAKLAGAPKAAASGLELHARLGQAVQAGEPLFTVQAEAPGELAYALAYADANRDVLLLEEIG